MWGLSEWKPIACGSVAVVWEARQLSLNRLVAVKVYQRELDERARRRFLREAAAAGKLSDHPGIVSVYDAGVLPDDRPYLIMELCPGGSLTQWLNPDAHPSEEEVRRIGVRIADALAAAHASGVLHRDVNPASILIDSQGDPRLADFGLAAVAGAEEAAAEALPATPAYAAPEAFSTKPLTEAADVFSLAATLYAVLAGYPPRNVGVPLVTSDEMVRLAERPIEPLPGVNRHLMDALLAALTNDPSARPTAAGFREQLATAAMLPQSGVAGIAHSATPTSHSIPTATAVDSQRAAIHPTTQAKKTGRTCCRRNDNGDRHHGSGNGLVGQRARPVAFTGGDHAECGAHGPEHQQPTKPQSSPGAGHSRGKGP